MILLDCPIEILRVSGYSDTSCIIIYLLANIVTLLSQNYSVTPRPLTFNLIRTFSYSSYCTHVVIYIPVFAH